MIKIGVIGTGHLGKIHSKLWKEHKDATLWGIFDIDLAKSKALAEEFDTKAFESMEGLLKSCDAVTIAAPTINHFEIAVECIKASVHCFIEKPICSTYEDSLSLIELAKKEKVNIQVGHVERFNPAIASLKSYEINPLFVEAHRLAQFKPRAIDVSVIHDLMIHDIDIVLSLVKSEIESIDANGVAVITETPDICNARLKFKNGAVANLTASRISANPMRKMRLFQHDAYFSIDFAKPDVEIFKLTDEESISSDVPTTKLGSIEAGLKNKNIYYEKPNVPTLNAILEEQKYFINSILNQETISSNTLDAVEAVRIAEEIMKLIQK